MGNDPPRLSGIVVSEKHVIFSPRLALTTPPLTLKKSPLFRSFMASVFEWVPVCEGNNLNLSPFFMFVSRTVQLLKVSGYVPWEGLCAFPLSLKLFL